MELLSKQHFVPGIVASESTGQNLPEWQYVLNDQDDLYAHVNAAGGMPPYARSLVHEQTFSSRSLFVRFPQYCGGWEHPQMDGLFLNLSSKTTGLSSAWP